MDLRTKEALKRLPAVDEAVRLLERNGGGHWPRWALVQAVREGVEALRREILDGAAEAELDHASIERRVAELTAPSLRPVFNATGVVLHTNLGRAPLGADALARLTEVARGYSNLEYRLDLRRRGSRHDHAAGLLCSLCGAEDAVVVNNNAAAVMLCLAAHATGREVIVSRGELIEIGGSFRLPDVMAASGAGLREVGATNRTHLHDYERAIGEQTAMLLKAHRSNYAVIGFTAEVASAELVELGRSRGLLTMMDLGSGSLLDLRTLGLPDEPTVQQTVAAGFDLVSFSGDKLLGGPQAGIIVGRAAAIKAARSHPLMRALRPDKLTLAALEATLEAYRDDDARRRLPAVAMLAASARELRARADRLGRLLAETLPAPWSCETVATRSRPGGGSLPEVTIESFALTLVHQQLGAEAIEARLRAGDPPVIARIEDDRLLLDLRTLPEDRLGELAATITSALTAD